jgi:DNA invertase Pin-like site-specific DNA recombinase
MVSDPVVVLAEEPAETLRALVLDGVRKLLGARAGEGPRAAKAGARRGRRSVMTPALQTKAQRLRDRGASPEEIAAEIGVSRATVYRFLRNL